MFLFPLPRGGVGTALPANAAEEGADEELQVIEMTPITISRPSSTSGYTTQTVQIDLQELWSLLEVEGVNPVADGTCTLTMLDNNGQEYGIDFNKFAEGNPEPEFDGWFAASDGTPTTWDDINEDDKNNKGTKYGGGFNIKFFQAFYPTSKPDGELRICHFPSSTDTSEGKSYTGKWAISNESKKKKVIFTFIILFYDEVENKNASHSMGAGDAPRLWDSYGEKGVIKMYLGGWKYQANSGKKGNATVADGYTESIKSQLASKYKQTSDTYLNSSNESTVDYWEKGNILTNYGDNDKSDKSVYYQCYFQGYREKSYGMADATSEFIENKTVDGKSYRHLGRYDEDFKGFGKGNPFTVPCFGTFFKFEPEQNGLVDLYMIQNGIVDLSASFSETGGLQSELKWRPTYIVDERGIQLTDDIDKGDVKVTMPTKRINDDGTSVSDKPQQIYIGWNGTSTSGTAYNTLNVAMGWYELPRATDVQKVSAFLNGVKTFKEEHADVWDGIEKYWGDGGSYLNIIPPSVSKDGWIAINKTHFKISFPVKAGKSYYVFNNNSKIGFCGFEFKGEGALTQTLDIDDINYTPQPGSYQAVTIHRSFKQGWNAICLPFSVTESKMREWFGSDGDTEDYELVTYNGCAKGEIPTTKEGLTAHFFRHAYQDIIAGYPYMLYIPAGAKALNEGQPVTFFNITIENDAEMVTFNKSTEYMDGSTKQELAKEDDYEFRGTYVPTDVPAGSYAVYGIGSNSKDPTSTGIRYVSSETRMNGLRSFLYPKYLDENSDAKAVARIVGTNFSDVIDDSMWDDATVINDLMEEMGFFDQRENVYSITGQIVRQNTTSLVGLPKGVYIVKGKKYFVK